MVIGNLGKYITLVGVILLILLLLFLQMVSDKDSRHMTQTYLIIEKIIIHCCKTNNYFSYLNDTDLFISITVNLGQNRCYQSF